MACDHIGARAVSGRLRALALAMRFDGMKIGAAAVALIGLMTAACAGKSTKVPVGTLEPDKFLYERGSAALDERKWFTAREFFRQLTDTYPQSQYRADAKLGIGDTYLGEGTAEGFVLAQNEFREFLAFYPTHRRADYAQFKLAMTHFYQMHGPERDQTETRDAIRELTAFVERWRGRNSPLLPEAEQKLREARDRLSESEYRVGFFYFRNRWYPGAIERFVSILKNDPGFSHRDAVYFHLGESLIKIERPAEALPYYDKLLAEFEKSEYLENARKRVDEIKAGLAAQVKKS
jgi:outer membrane protein assembly factor BamD